MSTKNKESIYDQLRPHLNAEDLIGRLGLELVRTSGSEAYCRPLCHESAGGESLQINLHTGRFNCKACQGAGVFGDLIDLVEYVRTGGAAPSHGTNKGGTVSHRDAVVWLCGQFAIAFDAERATRDAGLDAVHTFAMAAHEYLLTRPDVMAWFLEKWGFDEEDILSYGLGFMPSPMLPAIVNEAQRAESRGAFKQSGLGWFQDKKTFRTRFEGRALFPYLEQGLALYLIGRATPWTPPLDNGGFMTKYHKLAVHSEKRPYISERITNDHLYLETVMDTTDVVVIAEGIADAVALSSMGVPVVSPVTINFNKVDLERFTRKARERGITRVEILFDNELSGSGNHAARRVGRQLMERGLSVKVLTLPLGSEQQQARDEVIKALGKERFAELQDAEPRHRKQIIAEAITDPAQREWVSQNVNASKIDAAEWSVQQGSAAPAKIEVIRRAGVDIIEIEVADIVKGLDPETEPAERAGLFADIILLAAHVEDRLAREGAAKRIADAAGKGVTKAEILRRIAGERREKVKPKRKEEVASLKPSKSQIAANLTVLPPETPGIAMAPTGAPAPPPTPGQVAAPPAPKKEVKVTDHDRYTQTRLSVMNSVENKLPEEALGEFVSQTVCTSMRFTCFRTADDLYLVRGNQRIRVGLDHNTPAFKTMLFQASGLTASKASHRAYIAAAIYFLGLKARRVQDVAWSYVEKGTVFFPTGDSFGRILKITPGKVERTRMSEARVPAVPGEEFRAFEYVEEPGGLAKALQAFRWASLAPSDRLVLVYWIACLPILRKIGTIPIVRLEGGSGSGKTRAVDAVSVLVNGQKTAVVPTAAALISRLSTQMLTIDDNRETRDVTPTMEGTLLQATHLGAREKRKTNSDTGTVIERVSGALLMNGIEPIHDGRSELASRMLILHCSSNFREADSPAAESALMRALLSIRDAFWSEASRHCAEALLLDKSYGEKIGGQIEVLFGSTKIGRLSAYLRIMYFAWVAGIPEDQRGDALLQVSEEWRTAFTSIADGALESLIAEELSVSVLRYVFAHGASVAEYDKYSSEWRAFNEKYVSDSVSGDAYLGPIRATHLARLARSAAKELNAPRGISSDLRAGQLERRLLDGVEFIKAAGYEVEIETTGKGRRRFTFCRRGRVGAAPDTDPLQPPAQDSSWGGDTWGAPAERL